MKYDDRYHSFATLAEYLTLHRFQIYMHCQHLGVGGIGLHHPLFALSLLFLLASRLPLDNTPRVRHISSRFPSRRTARRQNDIGPEAESANQMNFAMALQRTELAVGDAHRYRAGGHNSNQAQAFSDALIPLLRREVVAGHQMNGFLNFNEG